MDNGSGFTRSFATSERAELADHILDEAWVAVRPELHQALCGFLAVALTPIAVYEFEKLLWLLLRRLGRLLMERALNCLEAETREQMPHDLLLDGGGYRALRDKTANRHVATLFGTICLMRRGYRYWHAGVAEASVFPLELVLGLVEGVTPALAERTCREMAEAGATQSRVIAWLKCEHGVSMGIKRLRALTEAVSQGMSEFQLESQVETLLSALQKATESSGNRKPVLSVGRDGITLCEYHHRFHEVATVATLSVFDRQGKRLTTVYLAHTPEALQVTMSSMLSNLLCALLTRWNGPLPQLAYVADSGGNESSYFETALKRMVHPRTGKRLHWQRVVDFYHAAERVWTMAECLFGSDAQRVHAWARSMLKKLKKASGASRVLHSAAAMRTHSSMSKTALKEFEKAYNYIRKRTEFMRYAQYKAAHIPLGSGITEAACKTVFTQRLKLSGMRWTKAGAKSILTLRTCLLSLHWNATFAQYLDRLKPTNMTPYRTNQSSTAKMVA
jgi:hypothetical protein